jgi:hypothetical protein
MVRILRQNAIHFLQSLLTQQPYAYWFSYMCVCVRVCMCVCVCACVISMDHGTSCYEVFLPLSLTCCFLQDVSPNTANSNSPLSATCICSPVLSQIISWCRAPELNRRGVFVVLSYWWTRCINSIFFLSFSHLNDTVSSPVDTGREKCNSENMETFMADFNVQYQHSLW